MKQQVIEVLMVEPGREPRIVKNQLVSDKCESFLLKSLMGNIMHRSLIGYLGFGKIDKLFKV